MGKKNSGRKQMLPLMNLQLVCLHSQAILEDIWGLEGKKLTKCNCY